MDGSVIFFFLICVGFFVGPSMIESQTVDLKTCDAVEILIVSQIAGRDTTMPDTMKSILSSIFVFGSRTLGFGMGVAKEQYPRLPSMVGCAVVYWEMRARILRGVPIDEIDGGRIKKP